MDISRQEKISIIKENNIKSLDDMTDEFINLLYKSVINKKKENEKDYSKIDKTTDQYKTALKFINKMLENLNKPAITDLTQFKNIDRIDVINKKNEDLFDEMKDELFKVFDKKKCGWYARKAVRNYLLTFLRHMVNELGLEITYRHTNTAKNNFTKSHLMYTII